MVLILSVSVLYFTGILKSSGFAASDSNSVTKPLFSIRMVDFESPVQLGSFLRFSYFVRDVSNTNDTAKLNFWLEKDGGVVSLGLDTLYLGNLEEKTRIGDIFLPSSLESGVYVFKIKLDYGGYSAESYRVIEIGVTNGLATINNNRGMNSNLYIFLSLVLLIFINIIILYFLKKKGGKNVLSKIKYLFKKRKR